MKPLFIIVLGLWFVFSFTACAPKNKEPTCRTVYRMPDGAVCKVKEVRSGAAFFSICSPDPDVQYLSPLKWAETEVCE